MGKNSCQVFFEVVIHSLVCGGDKHDHGNVGSHSSSGLVGLRNLREGCIFAHPPEHQNMSLSASGVEQNPGAYALNVAL